MDTAQVTLADAKYEISLGQDPVDAVIVYVPDAFVFALQF